MHLFDLRGPWPETASYLPVMPPTHLALFSNRLQIFSWAYHRCTQRWIPQPFLQLGLTAWLSVGHWAVGRAVQDFSKVSPFWILLPEIVGKAGGAGLLLGLWQLHQAAVCPHLGCVCIYIFLMWKKSSTLLSHRYLKKNFFLNGWI